MEAKYWQFSLETSGKSLSKSDSIFIDQRGQMPYMYQEPWYVPENDIPKQEKYQITRVLNRINFGCIYANNHKLYAHYLYNYSTTPLSLPVIECEL